VSVPIRRDPPTIGSGSFAVRVIFMDDVMWDRQTDKQTPDCFLTLTAIDAASVETERQFKQGNHRQQTSLSVPHSDELNQTL